MKTPLLALLLLFCSVTGAQTSEPLRASDKTVTSPFSRYQLIPAPIDDGVVAPEKTVFLIDTVTGKVWKYQAAFTSVDAHGKKIVIPSAFIPIEIGVPAS